LWVRFNLLCGREVQWRLHDVFRHEIKDWEKRGLVKGAVLTYHFEDKPTDSLYVCLDIPTVKTPHERTVSLSNETIEQIPSEIMGRINRICEQNQINFQVMDYEFNLESAKTGEKLYRNAPTEDVLRFASVGTKIALEILDVVESGERRWTLDKELARFILLRLKEELGENYFWLSEGWHFVCNPLLLKDRYMWIVAHAHTNNTQALDFLYSKHFGKETAHASD
jgi:hypothetical protein